MTIQEQLYQAYEQANGNGGVYLDTLSHELQQAFGPEVTVRTGLDLIRLSDEQAEAALRALPRHSATPVSPRVAMATMCR